jgi:hypothetical protein
MLYWTLTNQNKLIRHKVKYILLKNSGLTREQTFKFKHGDMINMKGELFLLQHQNY